MNTAYSNNVEGALKLLSVNGSVYQIGKDASSTVGGIMKLFGGNGAFETYSAATDGAYDAATVYGEIDALKTAIGAGGETPIAEQVSDLQDALGEGFSESATVADAVAAAKSVVAAASSDYITVTPSTDANDGHAIYTIGTSGIDTAISTAIAAVVDGAPETFDTLKEISDWITADTTGAAAILADVANKADKVSGAVNGNFAGLDANGNLTDSGYKAADFQAAGSYKTTQTAVSDPSANGNAAAFIDSISQDANGAITVTKKNVQAASASQAGLMSAADYSKLAAVSASVSGDTLTITTQAAA